MTDRPPNDLDDRVARLAARRAGGGTSASTSTAAAAPRADGKGRPAKMKRPHPAGSGRLIAAWVSSSVFLSIIAGMALQTQPSGASTAKYAASAPPRGRITATTKPRTKVVVKDVHHALYVDKFGRPISPASIPTNAVIVPAAGGAGARTSPATGASPSGGGQPSSTPASGGHTQTPGPTSSPAPVNTPSVGHTPAPSPAAPGHTSPPPTPAPHSSPPPTSPPPTSPPTTVHTPPPPPPPPPCTGSQCP